MQRDYFLSKPVRVRPRGVRQSAAVNLITRNYRTKKPSTDGCTHEKGIAEILVACRLIYIYLWLRSRASLARHAND